MTYDELNALPHLDKLGRPTLATVAELAGVHRSTASRALSRSTSAKTRVASPDTLKRIRDIAEHIGFTRNSYAAGLRTRRTATAGVLVPRLTDLVLATIYEGVDKQARSDGYMTFVSETADDKTERLAKLDMLLARQVDGVIIGDARTNDDEIIDELTRRDIPFVLVSRYSDQGVSVTCDDYEGGRLAARHLLELGHTRVAVVAGAPYASTGVDRTRGFVDTFAAAGHPVPPQLVVPSRFDVIGGREATARILEVGTRPPTGMFVVNDFAAIGAMGTLRERRLHVGCDVALVGYNDVQLVRDLPIPLTSVRSPLERMGATAMQTLLAAIAGSTTKSQQLQPALEARESTLGRRSPAT